MNLKNLNIKTTKRSAEIKPESIFRGLTLKSKSRVENLWAPQGEALNQWHDNRKAADIAIEMTTGGGKTLVGLLIGQSLVNETRGRVLYVCSTNQLVQQTAERAAECSLPYATYMSGAWENREHHDACTGVCLTNYDALFNSKSIFSGRDNEIRGLIFDDAHVAHDRIRGQYTLKLKKDSEGYNIVAEQFRQYFTRVFGQRYVDMLSGDRQDFFVPMFEVYKHAGALSKKLSDTTIPTDKATLFAWGNLKDFLNRCTILISDSQVEIGPYMMPIHNLPYFGPNVRRVYLTATVPSHTDFIRAFGNRDPVRVTPGGKSGEAQRQILFMAGKNDADQRVETVSLIHGYKACIITPSKASAQAWSSVATIFDRNSSNETLQVFKKSTDSSKIAMAARYDGIDLPGKSCRILVLDGLPKGEALLDRFLEEGIRIDALRAIRTSTRVVQALGRIFRSNNDHGTVILCGMRLHQWMSDPNRQQYLPKLLQQQVLLGMELHRLIKGGETTAAELIEGMMAGTEDWDDLYNEHVGAFEAVDKPQAPGWIKQLAVEEREGFECAWDGRFQSAAARFLAAAEISSGQDRGYDGWLHHLAGWCHELDQNDESAVRCYSHAANARMEFGRPPARKNRVVESNHDVPAAQIQRIVSLLTKPGKIRERMENIKRDLAYGPSVPALEQAIADLGEVIGLKSSRPDKTLRKGPDIIWLMPEMKEGIAFEAKTNKEGKGKYDKDDIGQILNHIQWMKATYPSNHIDMAIIGRQLAVTWSASPPEDLLVIPLEGFIDILNRYRYVVEFVLTECKQADVPDCLQRHLKDSGLDWPNVIRSLPASIGLDLQQDSL